MAKKSLSSQRGFRTNYQQFPHKKCSFQLISKEKKIHVLSQITHIQSSFKDSNTRKAIQRILFNFVVKEILYVPLMFQCLFGGNSVTAFHYQQLGNQVLGFPGNCSPYFASKVIAEKKRKL